MNNQINNIRLIKAALGLEVDRPPVWAMRQAGRYLPEFRELRKKYDFFTLVSTPELASEITLQPLNRFDLDAVIIFCDILVIPQALSMKVEMVPGKGPHFPEPLDSPMDLKTLDVNVDVNVHLKYVYDAIKLTCQKMNNKVPCIGFCGAPWTLMCYMIEGGGSSTVSKAKKWLYRYPEESHKLLSILSNLCLDFLVGQVKAGASYVQIFDTLAGHLSPKHFKTFSLHYLTDIAHNFKKRLREVHLDVPICVFAKGVHCLDDFELTEYDVIGLDWTINPVLARKSIKTKTLQGNMDPCVLYGSKEEIKKETTEMIRSFGTNKYIVNLGHGMYPDFEPENFQTFVESVVNYNQH